MSRWLCDYVEAGNKAFRKVLKMLVFLTLVQLLFIMWKMTTVHSWLETVRGVQNFAYRRFPTAYSMPKPPVACNTSAIWALSEIAVRVKDTPRSWASLEGNVTTNHPGGHYTPVSCDPQHRVAIVIPYRNRESQLLAFLQHMHPFLQRQLIEYRIFVIELVANITFNRALLMNVGFMEATKGGNFTCFIFHDVDLLPEDLRNLYICQDQPRHMSVAIDKFKYRLPYKTIIGGACAFTERQFRKVNGFSNKYFGWGGEDDDLYERIRQRKMNVSRYSANIARYKMIKHTQEKMSPVRHKLLAGARLRIDVDGLSSLKYNVLQKHDKPLYTWILVSVNTQLYGHSGIYSTSKRAKPLSGKEASVNTRPYGNIAKNSLKSQTKPVNGTKASGNARFYGHVANNSHKSPTKPVNGTTTSVNT